ncbi:hypothetical protein E6C76_16035 [Pseudothauera nasutitermitis]|uniref:Uncharacterized protein n=1 Tax=Pseudothauera nasutitermitis TaxID=2565930 RepID=A0A4S4ASH5_9RHOO|nr:hypothetical protein [Pseudothauera nasutitermitis]THF62782.1 hypothetical protein E6C76_16035 [Pseudothauera nasutitermitis]
MQLSISSISQAFFAWADQALSQPIPSSTVAFHFNLYEGRESVHVQLIGIDSFVLGDVSERDYWPGSETFSTGENIFEIPFSVAGAGWQEWQQTSIAMAQSYIINGNKSNVLKIHAAWELALSMGICMYSGNHQPSNMVLNHAPFGRWTLHHKAAQRQLDLR